MFKLPENPWRAFVDTAARAAEDPAEFSPPSVMAVLTFGCEPGQAFRPLRLDEDLGESAAWRLRLKRATMETLEAGLLSPEEMSFVCRAARAQAAREEDERLREVAVINRRNGVLREKAKAEPPRPLYPSLVADVRRAESLLLRTGVREIFESFEACEREEVGWEMAA